MFLRTTQIILNKNILPPANTNASKKFPWEVIYAFKFWQNSCMIWKTKQTCKSIFRPHYHIWSSNASWTHFQSIFFIPSFSTREVIWYWNYNAYIMLFISYWLPSAVYHFDSYVPCWQKLSRRYTVLNSFLYWQLSFCPCELRNYKREF